MTWVLASRNEGKVRELREIVNLDIVGLDGFDVADIVEDGASFEANALLKARAVAVATGRPALADDSGLSVAALNGMPGVLSARWAGRHGDDEANLRLLLAQIADVPDSRRDAAFVCAAAAVWPDGRELVVREQLAGRITREPRGENGFGYDPIFEITWDGSPLTTAELAPAQKNAISHRGRAFRALVEAIRTADVAGPA